MVTISHIVKKLIEERPFILENLSKGLINNAALAEEFIPIIEKELKKKVKFSAVNMAIRRYAENLEEKHIKRFKFDKHSDIVIKSDIIEVVFHKNEEVQQQIRALHSKIDVNRGDVFTVTQGFCETVLITNKKFTEDIEESFRSEDIKKMITSLSTVTINIPAESVNNMGLFYMITRGLAWVNINIVELVSTFTELTILLNEDDAGQAFTTLKKLIEDNQE